MARNSGWRYFIYADDELTPTASRSSRNLNFSARIFSSVFFFFLESPRHNHKFVVVLALNREWKIIYQVAWTFLQCTGSSCTYGTLSSDPCKPSVVALTPTKCCFNRFHCLCPRLRRIHYLFPEI